MAKNKIGLVESNERIATKEKKGAADGPLLEGVGREIKIAS
jgi:hypothetical protein